MSEWLKEHAWKACVGETLPWVRIPLSPPKFVPYFNNLQQTHQFPVRRSAAAALRVAANRDGNSDDSPIFYGEFVLLFRNSDCHQLASVPLSSEALDELTHNS